MISAAIRRRAAETARRRRSGRAAASVKPSSAAFLAKNLCGVCTRMPAPSPARGSAPTAPRCSRLSRIVSAVLDDLVRFATLDVGNKADTAGSFFLRRIEQAKPLRAHRHSPRSPRLRPRRPAPRFRHTPPPAAASSLPSAPEGEPFFMEATFVPLGGLGCLFCRRPTRPRPRRLAPRIFPAFADRRALRPPN